MEYTYNSIHATRNNFEKSFEEGFFYNRQTRDEGHLRKIFGTIEWKDGMKILDLGTGSGYLSFAMAEAHKEVEVYGLDIVEKTLAENRRKAEEKGIRNLQFISYDGIIIPFEADSFDYVVTRYALHHFPEINTTFQQIMRILKPGGYLFLSDPTPNEEDTERFVDAYMQMKKDGHIKFYRKQEFIDLAENAGLVYKKGFQTSIRFPKKKQDSKELPEILKRYQKKIVDGYDLEEKEDEIYITEKVLNLLFQKANTL